MKVDVKQTVSQLLETSLSDAGYELAEMVLSEYKGLVKVKVFVYGEHGVSLDECASLSRTLGDLIDATDMFQEGYTLEVSSPGLDRSLTTLRDYKYRIGETVRVDFIASERKHVRGVILSTDKEQVQLKTEDDVITLDLVDIKEARIVF